MLSVFLATIGRSRATHRSRARRGRRRSAKAVEDLLVGRVIRERRRRPGRFRGGRPSSCPARESRVLRVTCRSLIASLSSRSLAVSSSIRAWACSPRGPGPARGRRSCPAGACPGPPRSRGPPRRRGRAGQPPGHHVGHRPVHPRRGTGRAVLVVADQAPVEGQDAERLLDHPALRLGDEAPCRPGCAPRPARRCPRRRHGRRPSS